MSSPSALQQSAVRALPRSRRLRLTFVGCSRAFLALLAAALPAAAGAPRVVIRHATGGTVTVTVEVAATAPARERGLMFRQELPRAHGMLFVFPADADHAFWMRNTPLSLDIVFIDRDRRIVGIEANTVPYSERHLRVGRASRYVLEVAAGLCAREGVRVGDCVEFQEIPEIEGGERPCTGASDAPATTAP
jgi:hypothetical protein